MNIPETFFSVQEETVLFLLSCVAGLFIGVFYDFFRTLRIIFPHNSFFIFIEDMIFLAAYAVFLSAFASARARGELRFYFIIGNAIGFTIYFFTLGTFVVNTLRKFFGFFSKVFAPLKVLFVTFFKKAGGKFVRNYKLIKEYIKKLKILLQSDMLLLYNIRESKKRKNVNGIAEKKEKRKTKKTEKR